MRILQAHNYYQQAGGEDTVVEQEKKLLERNGHKVITYYKHNDEISTYNRIDKIKLVKETTWSRKAYAEIDQLLKKTKIDICHVHNTLPLISPSIYYACKNNNVPVVQTLHNYRLICTNGLLLRDGRICEDCLGRSAYGAIAKKCYRNSSMQTYVVARMLQKNKRMGTWNNQVDAYLCLTEMARQKFIEHGLPKEKLIVKPNFLEHKILPKVIKENYLVYAGRVMENKGAKLILELAKRTKYNIKIVGDGDMIEEFEGIQNVELLGRKTHNETVHLLSKAKAILFPTMLYEGMPMTIIEGFAMKTPVIATKIGAAESMIKNNVTGLLFETGSYDDFYKKVEFCYSNPDFMDTVVNNAFEEYKSNYTAESNYNQLLEIYNKVLT